MVIEELQQNTVDNLNNPIKISIMKKKNCLKRTAELITELLMILPNSELIEESNFEKITGNCCIIRIHEDLTPQYILIDFESKQIVFKIVNYKSRNDLGFTEEIADRSQLVLSKFTTDLGSKIAESLMDLFPIELESNQVVNFTTHKDFVYFRLFRFKIKISTTRIKDKKTHFQQIGPQLTLRIYRFTNIEEGEKKVQKFQKYIKNANLL
ncbi:rpf1 [Nucleospora cyclopteri]